MSSIGSFGAFTQARLGIYAAQHGLTVTGNNISNINTTGYTRQKLEQVSMRTGGADMYSAKYTVRVGNGALVTGISQIRDPYLDIRFRTAESDVYYHDTKLNGLEQIAGILDEVADGDGKNGLLHAELSEFADALRTLGANAGQEDFDVTARASAEQICILFRNYADRLQKLQKTTEDDLRQKVDDVNEILKSIRDLNASIRKSDIHGNNALEARDERNRLIDKLSQYMKINVTYSMEDVGMGEQVEKLTIRLGDANPDPDVDTDEAYLVDGLYCAQLTTPKKVGNDYVDENGQITGDAVDALQEFDSHYNITLSKMRDVKGREWSDVKVTKKEIAQADYNAAWDTTNGGTAYLDDPGQGTRTSTIHAQDKKTGKYYEIVTTTQYTQEVVLDDNDLHGSIQAVRELLTEEGEFASRDDIKIDEEAALKRGIPYYQKSLDLLAQTFAQKFNELNYTYKADGNGYYYPTERHQGGCNLTYGVWQAGCENLSYDQLNDAQKADLAKDGTTSVKDFLAEHADKVGLFSNSSDSDDMENITALNISISKSWSSGMTHIVTSEQQAEANPGVDQSTQSDNVNHMISLLDKDLVYNPQDLNGVTGADVANSSHLFEGTFQEMMNKMVVLLGEDQQAAQIELTTSYTSSVELDSSRDSVAGVDLNDEAMNMIQYQKAYSAACRLMTAIDEVLEKLINGTAV